MDGAEQPVSPAPVPALKASSAPAIGADAASTPSTAPPTAGPGRAKLRLRGRSAGEGQGRESAASAAIRWGDPDAIRTIWQENRSWIAALLLVHRPREVELDDLLQDVAMTVVRTIRQVQDERALPGWLRQVALNTARAAGRKQTVRRRAAEALREGAAAEHDPEQSGFGPRAESALPEREETRRVLRLAQQLPEAYREPLLLRCARGMSYRRISAITGLPETTVETRIARGRRMLREMAKAHTEPKSDAKQSETKTSKTITQDQTKAATNAHASKGD